MTHIEQLARHIIDSWDQWDGEAMQAAQIAQHPEAGVDVLVGHLVPILEQAATKCRPVETSSEFNKWVDGMVGDVDFQPLKDLLLRLKEHEE